MYIVTLDLAFKKKNATPPLVLLCFYDLKQLTGGRTANFSIYGDSSLKVPFSIIRYYREDQHLFQPVSSCQAWSFNPSGAQIRDANKT